MEPIPVKLNHLNPEQQQRFHLIMLSLPVQSSMLYAYAASAKDGLERGFFIYQGSANDFYPGKLVKGTSGSLPTLFSSFGLMDDGSKTFGVARAYYHTHPGNYPGVGQADGPDRAFGHYFNIIVIIQSREGWTVGT